LKSWNDDRGFGFIEPVQGGQEIFVHIKAFPPRSGRPQVNQPMSFEIGLNAQGKKRAINVQLVRPARNPLPGRKDSLAQWGTASLFAIPGFLVVYLAAAIAWGVPKEFLFAYVGVSVVCFMAYAFDKSAARSGGWRTPESTLLALGLAGGWPGAILAQQLLRHKSNKPTFRSAFWGTVVLNVVAFVLINSPLVTAR
jgi:uncharacterized membrane protein YsdA (DUF1294 family)/cold shock CspA family protein